MEQQINSSFRTERMVSDLIRVVLADDHTVVRTGLKAVLGTAKDIDVVGEAKDGREAIALVERFKPDLVVMDLAMAGMDGLAATQEIVAKQLPSKVLVLTMHEEEEYLMPVLKAGAAGYLVKSAADRELIDAIRAIAHGDVYVRGSAARVLAKGVTKKDPHQADRECFERLTERERDVLRLTAQGYSAPEIGDRLFISPKTVDTYKQRIHEKVGLGHRAEYVQFALRLGLLNNNSTSSSSTAV
jgi:DNA-binding NarL/FixJ family response regulator